MRDHTKLRAFELADALAVSVYQQTAQFPRDEQFGLTSQMRRAAVSAAANIVEGSARQSLRDYIRFLDMAYASTRELEYHVSLARRLMYCSEPQAEQLHEMVVETGKVLSGLIRALRKES
jgi:four helix bundle protein